MIRLIILWLGMSQVSAWAGDGFDHSHKMFHAVLDGAVSNKGVDYAVLAERRSQLEKYLSVVANAPVSSFGRDQKLAFWVNAYNAYTISLILEEQMPKSIMDLDGGKVWDTRVYPVGGERLSLNAMEHQKARPLTDGRVHAALNCASRGCPPLGTTPLRADGDAPSMDKQLNAAARRWVSTNAYSGSGTTVSVSLIFDWFSDDFRGWEPTEKGALNKKEARAIAFIKAFGAPVDAVSSVTFQPYDWALNKR